MKWFFPVFILLGCSGALLLNHAGIQERMKAEAEAVSAGGRYPVSVDGGKNGFFFALDSECRILFHPNPVLIGSKFDKSDFVREIISRRSGCLSYGFMGKKHLIFFEPVNDDDILCFSIPASSVSGTDGACSPINQKKGARDEEKGRN
ncbi:MAG: hypothetical protein MUD12_11675 [Spirochaetes bacterium]|nr:hypothetical protein [Spirochaetota bacterium]